MFLYEVRRTILVAKLEKYKTERDSEDGGPTKALPPTYTRGKYKLDHRVSRSAKLGI
jgi:hypothetical protein